jgi:hypothetical protein
VLLLFDVARCCRRCHGRARRRARRQPRRPQVRRRKSRTLIPSHLQHLSSLTRANANAAKQQSAAVAAAKSASAAPASSSPSPGPVAAKPATCVSCRFVRGVVWRMMVNDLLEIGQLHTSSSSSSHHHHHHRRHQHHHHHPDSNDRRSTAAAAPAPAKGAPKQRTDITMDEVKRHNKKDDWYMFVRSFVCFFASLLIACRDRTSTN